MIAANVLPTWRLGQLADGLMLTPPEGMHLGGIRIREAQRPLVSATRLFARAAQRLPASKLDVGPIERMITCEGEYAAIQIQRGVGIDRHAAPPFGGAAQSSGAGPSDGGPFIRCLGAVFGDDSFTFVDAGTTIVDRFAFFEQAVRTFTFYMSLGLGYRRRRRFEYEAPRGWDGIACDLDAMWMPAEFPGIRAVLTVHAAEPAGATPADVRDAIVKRLELAGLSRIVVSEPERRFTGGELSGVGWRATGDERGVATCADIVVLEDERFIYPLELVCEDACAAVARATFDAVVHSARSIPLPEAQPQIDSSLHWVT